MGYLHEGEQQKWEPVSVHKIFLPAQLSTALDAIIFVRDSNICISAFCVQAILPIEQSIPRSTYIHPPAVNAAKGAF